MAFLLHVVTTGTSHNGEIQYSIKVQEKPSRSQEIMKTIKATVYNVASVLGLASTH